MLITTQNEIVAMMPTNRWDEPKKLFGYLEEEEAVALEPLLGTALYQHVIKEYDRLRRKYVDITATTVRPSGKAKQDARLAHADVTERLELIQQGRYRETYTTPAEGEQDVDETDMTTIRLIRICQQIEFYRMLSHNGWMLAVSFNEGGGLNSVTADGYDEASVEKIERAEKEAFMKAGRSTDALLLFLEADAKGEKLFTEKWREADAFYLHQELLFQTARVLNEYLPIKSERMAYISLVRDIRFCQDTYIEPRIGTKLLDAVVDCANNGSDNTVLQTLVKKLRIALAFYVESRRVALEPVKEKLARRDSMTDAQQAMSLACCYIEDNLDELGEAAVGTPIYKQVKEAQAREEREKRCVCAAEARRRKEACEQSRKKMFTGFPMTHIGPERN